MKFKDKVVVITGAAQGLGQALAQRLSLIHICPVRSNSVEEAPYIKGGFAEYMYVFPGTFMWQVPEEMPSNVASLLDPTAVAMRAVELAMRSPGIFEDSFNLGSTVLVIGDGQVDVYKRQALTVNL